MADVGAFQRSSHVDSGSTRMISRLMISSVCFGVLAQAGE
jgi:hypothetical protein